MGYDKDTRNYRNTSENRRGKTDEQRAREEAYREYLRLREGSGSRGNYVKNDDLYGSYFSNNNSRRTYDDTSSHRSGSTGSSIDDTPYGASEMRRRSKKENIARQGRVNKADMDKPEEMPSKKSRKKNRRSDNRKPENKKGGKKKGGRGLRIAVIVVLIFVLGIGGVLAAGMVVIKNTLDNVGKVELDPNLIGINAQVDEDLKNYRNIALLGIDARDMTNDSDVRSDAIIIVSIDKKTKEIKMFSIYRDTMLYQGEEVGLDKITHAYYHGGPTKVLYTINKNLDMNVKEVVIVNWKSVADMVDALGGLNIEVQESEIDELNYITQHTANTIGGPANEITEPGMQTLDGNQAVAYARIRKDAATGDYRRNERMKIVVKATFEKAKELDAGKIRKISKEILPQIKTNMSTGDMMGLALNLTSYTMTDSVGFPYDHRDMNNGVFYGVPVTLESNVTKLHEQFFMQDGYVPTTEVLDISKDISYESGYY